MSKKISNSFSLNDNFVRTPTTFHGRVEVHNRERTTWIGKGKKFSDLYKPNSYYRRRIVRGDYCGNGSMIDQDIKWDIKHGWIKKV